MSSLPRPREIVASLISSIQHSHQDQTTNPLINATQPIQKALLTLHVLFPNELLPALYLLDRNLITRLTTKTSTTEQDEARQQTHDSRPVPDPRTLSGHRSHSSLHPIPNQPGQLRPLPQLQPSQPGIHAIPNDPRQLRHLPELPPSQPIPGETPVQLAPQHQTPPHLSAHPPNPHNHDVENLLQQSAPLPQERSSPSHPAHARHAGHAEVYMVRSGQLSSRSRAVRDQPAATKWYEVRLDARSCSCPAFAFAAFPAVVAERELMMDQHTHDLPSSNWSFGGLTLGNDLPVCKHLLACTLVQHSSIFAAFVEEREVSIEELAGWAAGWGD